MLFVVVFLCREEEVQGVVQYIYTGQLSTQKNGTEGSAWEKIIEDFKVGLPPDSTEGRNHNNIHQKTSPAVRHKVNSTTQGRFTIYFLLLRVKQKAMEHSLQVRLPK